jgi:23S rRNA pseudouridine1911/1915/1917 synthase
VGVRDNAEAGLVDEPDGELGVDLAGALTFTVPNDLDGERLDKALSLLVDSVSRARLAQWVRDGRVKVHPRAGERLKGGGDVKPSFKLLAGQQIRCLPPPDPTPTLTPQEVPFEVIYRDDEVAVVLKPAGVVVHPGAGQPDQTLVNGLLHRFGALSPVGHPTRPGIIHRLDRDTSGLLMVALTERAHHHLVAQLSARSVERRYLALAWRPPEAREGSVEGGYGRDPDHRLKFTGIKYSEGARGLEAPKWAKTNWRVLEDFGPCALFELRLETGRTHQIRVHLSELGSPLLADALYGQRRRLDSPPALRALGPELGLTRHALHATTLGFDHPVTGERLRFESPLPDDLAACLSALRASVAG